MRFSVAPEARLTGELGEKVPPTAGLGRACVWSVPAEMIVAPGYVLDPVSSSTPAPTLASDPLALSGQASVNWLPLVSNVAVMPLGIVMVRFAARDTLAAPAWRVLLAVTSSASSGIRRPFLSNSSSAL